MTMRFSVQASIFALCLGASSLAYAATEPELAFHPSKPWTVKEAPVGGVCTLGNEFNNGFALQMAGNAQGIDQINIDFRQPVFEMGSTHEVTVAVPGAKSATTQAQAADPQMLVIELEGQKALSEALRKTAVLDVKVQENEFRFFLTGFADATARFDACIAGEPLPAAAVRQAAAPQPIELPLQDLGAEEDHKPIPVTEIVPPPPMPEISEEKVQAAMVSAPTSVEGEKLARPQPREGKSFTEQMQEEMNARYTPPEPAEYMKPYLAEPASSKEAAKDKSPKKDEKVAKKTPEPQPETIAWIAEPVKPEPVRISAKTPDPVVSRTKSEAEIDLSGVYTPEDLGRKDRPAAKALQQARSERKPFEEDLERIEPSASRDPSIRDDRGDLARKISELEATVYKLKSENAALDAELKSSLQESREERVAIASDNWNLERATMRYNEAERQIQRLGQQLQRERAECSLEKQRIESMLFDPEVTNQQQIARLAELESQLQAAQAELDDQRRRYEERIKILEGRLGSN